MDRADAADLTAVAVLSAPGRSALASIGLVGPRAAAVLQPLFQPRGRPWDPNEPRPRVGMFAAAGLRDEVVLRRAGLPQRPWWELTPLGSPAVVAWLMDALVASGARQVTWDVWLQLTEATWWQAEFARLLLQAETERTAALLHEQGSGRFGAALEQLARLPDQATRQQRVGAWLQWETWATHLTRPWRVVLAGPPNVGKSTLMNALVGFERALADPVPGTTRDVVTSRITVEGWPVELMDTAGLRNTCDPIEAAGQVKAAKVRAEADLVLWLRDASTTAAATPDCLATPPCLTVWTKIDLSPAPAGELAVSALTGMGVEELRQALARALVPAVPGPETPLAASPALAAALRRAAAG